MTRKLPRWLLAAILSIPLIMLGSSASGQDEFEDWTPGEDRLWTNDDNWSFDGELSGAPSIDLERGARINGGLVIIDEDVDTAGIVQNGGTIEIQDGSLTSAGTDFQTGVTSFSGTVIISDGAGFSGPDTSFGRRAALQLLGAGSEFETSGDLSFAGNLHFPITGDGNPSLKVGGAADFGGVVSPSFDGVTPGFGDNFTFLESGGADVEGASVVLPAGVSLPLGLEARIVSDGDDASLTFSNLPVLQVDRASGATRIMNVVGGPLTMTGYAIESALGTMNPDNFTGFGGDAWDRPNPVTTSVAEFNLTGDQTLNVGDSLDIGNVYNGGATHPLDEDVVFRFVSTEGEVREGLVQYVGPANDLVLNINPETGEATVQHLSAFIDPVDFTGYSISSESGSLVVDNLTSFSDTGNAGEGWAEANPTATLISELNLSNSTVFENGTVVSLGNIFDLAGSRDIEMQYTVGDEILDATVEYQVGGGPPPPPTCAEIAATRTPGDADGIGGVAFLDFLAFAANFGQEGGYEQGDFNCNGMVEFLDFLVLAENFGQPSAAATASVPEPGTGFLLGLGGLLCLGMRRRRVRNVMKTKKNLVSLMVLPALVLLCGQANAQVCDLDDCPEGELRVFTGEVANINGPGDIISLRQPENILYAVNVWGEELEREVNGVTFWSDHEEVNPDMEGIEGYRTDWTHTVTNWQNKPEFGDSASEDELEEIMTDIRWTNNGPAAHPDPGVGSHFAVQPGAQLYLELLISGNHNETRIWDIYVDGEPVVSEFDSTNYREYDAGEVYAYRGEFIAKDDEFNVTFNQERRAGIDGNAILQAVILSVAGDPLLIGDFNSDGSINVDDYGIMVSNFHKEGAAFEEGDINFDRIINIHDFAQFRDIFSSQMAGASAVPEPSAAMLLAMGLSVLGLVRKRRNLMVEKAKTCLPSFVGGRSLAVALAAAIALSAGTRSAEAELIGYWPFEGNTEDASGNDFHAEGIGEFGYVDDGFRGQAGDFGGFGDGSAVILPEEFATSDDGFNKIVESQDFTISFFFKDVEGASHNQWSFLFGGSRQIGSHAPWGDGNVYFDIAGCCGGNQRISASMNGTDVDTDEWHHIAYVKRKDDGAEKSVTAVYIDGEELVSSPGWPEDFDSATIDDVGEIDGAAIGADLNGGSSHDGLMDEFAIWDEALEPDRIAAIAQGAPILGTGREPPGDFNSDGVVDTNDFALMLENFGKRFAFADEPVNFGDYNGDLRVNLKDFIAFRNDFNAAGAATAVPEPSSLVLVLMATPLLMLRRRR